MAMNHVVKQIFHIINDVPDIYITSKWGYRSINGVTSFHYGTDYGTNLKNLSLYAVENGEVTGYGYEASGAGHWIRIYYKRLGVWFAYFHMKEATTLKVGQTVSSETLCGYTGTTGNSTGIHLHLEIRDASYTRIDPEAYAKNYVSTIPTEIVGTPVLRNDSVNQLEITTDTLFARKRPEYNDATIIGYIKKGIYNINGTRDMRHEASNQFLWYEVESNIWISFSDKWAILYEARHVISLDDKDSQILNLLALNQQLTAQNTELKKTNVSHCAALAAIREIITRAIT